MRVQQMTTAATYFATEYAVRQTCGDAVSLAERDQDREFAQSMMKQANQFGLRMPLSERQLRYLCSIALVQPPKRIER